MDSLNGFRATVRGWHRRCQALLKRGAPPFLFVRIPAGTWRSVRDCWCAPGVSDTCNKRFDWQLGGLPQGHDHKYIYSNIGYNLKPTDLQPAYQKIQRRVVGELSNTDRIMNDTFFVGVYPGLTDAMIDYVIEQFRSFILSRRKKPS